MIQAICWVLIHSLWEGVLLALAGGGVILCTRWSVAAVRYWLLCGLLGIFVAGMGITFFYEWMTAAASGEDRVGDGVSINWLGDWCSAHAVQVVAGWLAVVVIKSARVAAGWSYMRRMRREGLAAPALWVGRMGELSRQLRVRRPVKLIESALVRVPMVIGRLRPIIYIPLGLINHLPASEMEAVILHELAHIRRHDHLVHMVQQVAECLLFFNPGFLWISALIREERENCCDDMAIAHTRDRVEFVRALVRFKEHSMRATVLAFPGNGRQLLHRVLRISRQENKTLSGRERWVLLGGLVIVLCLLAARAGRADARKLTEPGKEEQLAQVQPVQEEQSAQVQPVKEAPADMIAVLRAREQVAQNMEWVRLQLNQLHRKPPVRKQVPRNKGQVVKKSGQDQREREEVQPYEQQADRDREKVQPYEQQADRDREEAERDRRQAELDRRQAELDRQQADRDREQAERDRQQAERERQQAQQQAERDRKQAQLQAERDRQQAELDRRQADRERSQAELDRQRAEREAKHSKNN